MYSKKLLLFVLIALVFMTGCGKPQEKITPEDRAIATINSYKLTVADFKEDMKTTIAHKFMSAEPARGKEGILEELITREVLVQEAQKENFDKDKSFRREIERYWEQALVKLLLKKKLQEISAMIHVDRAEIVNEYNNMKREVPAGKEAEFPSIEALEGEIKENILKRKKETILEKWVDGLRKKAKVKVDRKILDEIEVD